MDTNMKLLFDETSELVDMTQYRQIIGSLMYLTNTRPYICFAMNTLSQYIVKPTRVHLIAAKHVIRYRKCTIYLGLYYGIDHDYTNSDWVGIATDKKSTSGGCYCLGSTMISWVSTKRSSVSIITTEA